MKQTWRAGFTSPERSTVVARGHSQVNPYVNIESGFKFRSGIYGTQGLGAKMLCVPRFCLVINLVEEGYELTMKVRTSARCDTSAFVPGTSHTSDRAARVTCMFDPVEFWKNPAIFVSPIDAPTTWTTFE